MASFGERFGEQYDVYFPPEKPKPRAWGDQGAGWELAFVALFGVALVWAWLRRRRG